MRRRDQAFYQQIQIFRHRDFKEFARDCGSDPQASKKWALGSGVLCWRESCLLCWDGPVAWTGLELVRLWPATRLSLRALRAEEADSASHGRHPNMRRYADWDE